MKVESRPWFADYANYVCSGILPPDLSFQQRKKFLHEVKNYFWDEPFLFKKCVDQVIRRCVPEGEMEEILKKCHDSPYGGHCAGQRTGVKVLQSGFYWPTLFKDAKEFVQRCDRCQRTGNLSWRNELPQEIMLEVELFDVGVLIL